MKPDPTGTAGISGWLKMEEMTLHSREKQALVLLAHGARNPDWARPFLRVKAMVQDRLPDTLVEMAFLEFMSPDLPMAIRGAGQSGCQHVTIAPLFFGQSGHVLRDVPPMIASLQQAFPAMRIDMAQAAGEDTGVLEALVAYCVVLGAEAAG